MTNIVPESGHIRNKRLNLALLLGIITLVGVAAFGLGRLSATPASQSGVIIHQPNESTEQ